MPNDPFQQGMQYALEHGSAYQNPYPRGSEAFNEFERGWSQALKRYSERVARIDSRRDAEEIRDQELEKEQRRKMRESYRKAKEGGE